MGKLEQRKEVANLEEHDGPVSFGTATGMETACFGGEGRPTLQHAMTSS
jgi:hypothetical protein